LAELLTRRVKYTGGAGCRRQQQASGCRGQAAGAWPSCGWKLLFEY